MNASAVQTAEEVRTLRVPDVFMLSARDFFVESNNHFTLFKKFKEEVVDYLGENDRHMRHESVSYFDLTHERRDTEFDEATAFREVSIGFVLSRLLTAANGRMTKYFRGGGAYTLFPIFRGGLAYVRFSHHRKGWVLNVESRGKRWAPGTRVYGYPKPTIYS